MKRGFAAAAVCTVLLATAALCQPSPAPRQGREWQDVELASIAMDIYLLQRINDCAFSPQQIRRVIPVLERVLADTKRLRTQVKSRLLQERRRLILGQEPSTPPDEIRRTIVAEAGQLREQARRVLESTRAFLSPQQVQKLQELVAGRPRGLFFRGGEPPAGRQGREPRAGEGMRPPTGPNQIALTKVIALLREKLAALGG